jgi:AcrR family transcriptional regulator
MLDMNIRKEPQDANADAAEGAVAVPARPLRADAERNRKRILGAAADVFTTRGLEATLDDVAKHAGVGVGTVYRRFPDKGSLLDALFEERIDAVIALAEQIEDEPDAWTALVTFLQRLAELLAENRGLRELLLFAAHGHRGAAYARDQMRPVVDRLLTRAKAAGQVRADLSATDMPVIEFMISATAAYTRDVRPELWRRYLALILDSLRPARDDATPLPEPALSPDELVLAINRSPLGRDLGRLKPCPHDPAGDPR